MIKQEHNIMVVFVKLWRFLFYNAHCNEILINKIITSTHQHSVNNKDVSKTV